MKYGDERNPGERSVDIEEKLMLVEKDLEEIVTRSELRQLLEAEKHPKAYWGFEPSGQRRLRQPRPD
ncbi:hypothetical protein [Candidatus Hecatella orcuttiae]|jgi:hypothetical protein|uniref:hypothetical protein n=1 Tax=Candidatus Hecatella orcuttiae TaxID=1935119 RepID=UPI002867BD5C|nr:hypothetical protein [Candidatus Hecatella orcuttiae]